MPYITRKRCRSVVGTDNSKNDLIYKKGDTVLENEMLDTQFSSATLNRNINDVNDTTLFDEMPYNYNKITHREQDENYDFINMLQVGDKEGRFCQDNRYISDNSGNTKQLITGKPFIRTRDGEAPPDYTTCTNEDTYIFEGANITKGNQKLNNCKGDKNIYGSLVSNINNYNRDGRRFDYKYPYYSPFCKIDNSKQWTLISSGIDTDWNGSTSGNKVSEEKFYNTQNNTEYMKNNIDNTNIQNFKSFSFKDNNLSSIPSDSDSNMLMNANSQDTITTKQNYYINFRSEMLNPNEKAGPKFYYNCRI